VAPQAATAGTALLAAVQNEPLRETLQRIADDVRAKNHLPCLVLGIRKGDLTVVVASGGTFIGSGVSVEPSSKIHLGSNTKAMTAVLAARLVQEGKIDWTTKAAEVLPFLDPQSQLGGCDLLDLCSHTSGVDPHADAAGI